MVTREVRRTCGVYKRHQGMGNLGFGGKNILILTINPPREQFWCVRNYQVVTSSSQHSAIITPCCSVVTKSCSCLLEFLHIILFYLLNNLIKMFSLLYSQRQRKFVALFSTEITIFHTKNTFRSKSKITQFHLASKRNDFFSYI